MRVSFSHLAAVLGRLLIALAIGLAAFILQARPASAYTLEGVRWAGQPSSGCCAHLTVNMQSTYYQKDITGWQNGRSAWNSSPANIWWNTTTGYTPISLYDTYESGVQWVGEAPYDQSGGYFTLASGYLNYYYTQNMTADAIQAVAGHELGHIAGPGHSQYCFTLMYPEAALCQDSTPQTDDVNGMDALY